jgi:hypothetical protein
MRAGQVNFHLTQSFHKFEYQVTQHLHVGRKSPAHTLSIYVNNDNYQLSTM